MKPHTPIPDNFDPSKVLDTVKDENFAQAVARHGVYVKAYRETRNTKGIKKTQFENACRLMSRGNIVARVQWLQEQSAKEIHLDPNWVLRNWAEIIKNSMGTNDDGEMINAAVASKINDSVARYNGMFAADKETATDGFDEFVKRLSND